MRAVTLAALYLIAAFGSMSESAMAAQDTDIAGVTGDIAFARQYDGVLHLGIVLHNPSTKEADSHQAINYGDVVVVDAKANKKYFPLKDANGHFLAGPISDWNGGGRWFPKLIANSNTLIWILFDSVSSTAQLTVEGPVVHSFANVAVTDKPPPSDQDVASSIPPLRASVTSATRANGQLKVRVKISNPEKVRIGSHTVSYRDVYVLDPQGKRSYPLLKDTQGFYLAAPMADKNDGGRWFLSKVEPNGQALVDLTFQAPPDTVRTVDVVFPWFGPFEAVAIAGEGGASDSGLAVAGRSVELQRALKELGAEDTPQQIKVKLSADVLFDFDKADIKPAGEPDLKKVATVLKSYPNARVTIDGFTDGKGNDSYNQNLSEMRAANVATWLTTNGGINGANLHTQGWGKAKPVAPNTKPDGSDDPDGRAKNRRVEITVTKS